MSTILTRCTPRLPPSPSPLLPSGCAPGLAYNSTSGACDTCRIGNFCPGSGSKQESAVRTPCGTNKVTTTELARSSTECVVLPGYGWASGNNAALCPVGFYNPGYNTRTCSRCPGGLTTAGPGANSTQDCVAPAGAGHERHACSRLPVGGRP